MALDELKTWRMPALFIPGNHDQVTLGGLVHALAALQVANPLIHVLTDPTEYLGALWLPYRRDHALIEQAINEHPSVSAIFAHVDIVGAFMNEAFQAKSGLDPSVFPSHLPVYTGHYHRPHRVGTTSIEYIGSPYQVSMSEAGQAKHFLVLDASWQKVDEISIDVGPRHHILAADTCPTGEALPGVREGDRVRWELPDGMSEEAAKEQTEWLRAMRVDVELVQPPPAAAPRIASADNLDAYSLLEEYAKSVDMAAPALELALATLRSLDLPARMLQRPSARLALDSVQLEGYGPFLGLASYPLAARGVRIVSGQNLDSSGAADSNGAGKTTLVMAPLWALSGNRQMPPVVHGSQRGTFSSTRQIAPLTGPKGEGGKARKACLLLVVGPWLH
eukprot:jgi/Mesen1/9225/ME000591S08544